VGSVTGRCSWTCISAGRGICWGTWLRRAPPRWPRSWSRWGRRPARRTTGPGPSVTTMPSRSPAGGWSSQAALRARRRPVRVVAGQCPGPGV